MKCQQCGKRGFKGRQGLRMHIGRVHEKTIIPPYTQDAIAAGGSPYRKPRRRIVKVEDHADHAEPSGDVAVVTRTTTRRAEETVTEQAIVPVRKFTLNGCPNCFFPIGLMHEDLAARKIACPPYCPNCTCPVAPVRTALNLVARQPSLAHA